MQAYEKELDEEKQRAKAILRMRWYDYAVAAKTCVGLRLCAEEAPKTEEEAPKTGEEAPKTEEMHQSPAEEAPKTEEEAGRRTWKSGKQVFVF